MMYPGDAAAAVCSGRAVSLVAASAGYPLIVPAPAAAAAYCYIHRHGHTSMTLENIEDIIDNSDLNSDSVLFDL